MKTASSPRQSAKINVKVAVGVEEPVTKLLSETPGLQNIVQLFPDESDEELRAMYLIDVAPEHLQAAMTQLRRNPGVESAHETAPRKLIR